MKQRKKLYVRIALLFAAIFSVGCVFMAACGNKNDTKDTEPAHTHSYSVTESKDATCTEDGYVTYTCECGDTYTETVKSAGHTWDKGTVTKEATCTAEGETTYTCSVCGETKTEAIPMTEHTYVENDIAWDWTWNEDKGYTDVTATAKCNVCQTETTVDGTITSKPTDGIYGDYTATAELGGKTYSDTKTAVDQGGSSGSGEVHTHIYGTPTWTWDEENYSYATATFTCTDESCPDEDGQKTVEVKAEGNAIQQTVTTAATCGTDGSCTYTATVTVSFGEGAYSDTTKAVTIPATGAHTYADIVESDISWDWETDYSACKASVTVSCTVCSAETTYTDDNCTIAENAEKSEASTCTQAGHVVYTATATLNGEEYSADTAEITLPLADHAYPTAEDVGYFVWPTSMEGVEENETVSLGVMCTVCNQTFGTIEATVTGITTQGATPDTNGKTTYTVSAAVNGETIVFTHEVTIPATGHSYPEATDTTYVVWDWDNRIDNTVTVTIYCKDGDGHVMETGTAIFSTETTKEPSCTEAGVLTYTASFTATGNGVAYEGTFAEDIAMTEHTPGDGIVYSDGYWYVECSVCEGPCGDPITDGTGYTFNVATADELKAAAAIDNAIIVLSCDITATVEIKGTITIDLSGHTLTGSGTHTITVGAGGKLTMEDTGESGVVDNISNNCAAVFVEVGGEAKLVGGTYTRSLENGDGGTYYTIVNHGTMTICEDVTVKTEAATTSSMVENGWAAPTDNATGATATLIIEGGTFTGGASNLIKNDDYGELVVKDGEFTDNGVSVILNYGELEISDGTFTQESATNNSLVIWNAEGGVAAPKATINGGTFTGGEVETLYNGTTGTVIITGGVFEGAGYYALYNAYNATITISGGTFTNAYAVILNYGEIVITGGEFKSAGNYDDVYIIWNLQSTADNAAEPTIKISGGTFTAKDESDCILVIDDGTAEISGGTFIVTEGEDIQAIQDALTEDNEAVIILGCDEVVGVVKITTSVTIDLNGKTLVNDNDEEYGDEEHTITVADGGYLVIKDSVGTGKIDNITHGYAALYVGEDGTAILYGGTYERSEEAGSGYYDYDADTYIGSNGGNSYYTIVNHGTLYIADGVTVINSGNYSSVIENGWYYPDENEDEATATLVIGGGTFSGGLNTIKNDEYGELTIYGGTFTNGTMYVVMNWSEVTIEDGTFTSEGGYDVIVNFGGKLTIGGGTFEAKEYAFVLESDSSADATSEVTITGGTFKGTDYAMVIAVYDGTLTIDGGTFVAANCYDGGEELYYFFDVLYAWGGGTITVTGGTLEGWIQTEDGGTITVCGGNFTLDPTEFVAEGYTAEYNEGTKLYEVVEVSAYIVSAEISETEVTLDLVNGEDQVVLTITVTMSDYSDYEGTVTWTIISGEDVVKMDENDGLSATVTILGITGVANITAAIDGTEYEFEITVIVIDSNTTSPEDLPSISIDFSNSDTYSSWLAPGEGETELTASSSYNTGILTYYTNSSTGSKSSVKSSDGYFYPNGATSNGRYFEIDLEGYEGYYVSVTAEMTTGSKNKERSMMLSTSSSTTNLASSIAYVTSAAGTLSKDNATTLSYTTLIDETNNKLYLTWDASIYIYTLEIVVSEAAAPTPAVSSVEITGSENGIELVVGQDSVTLTAVVTMVAGGEYGGGYTWSSSNESYVTVSGNGSSATLTPMEAGNATVTVRLWNDASKSATCSVTVVDLGADPSEHKYSFSYDELKTTMTTNGKSTSTDNLALDNGDFEGANSFLTVIQSESTGITYRSGNSCFEIRSTDTTVANAVMSVTFNGTGTISITFSSTGGSNTSNFGLMDANGNFLTGSVSSESVTESNGIYEMTGTTSVTITYEIQSAGTYYFYSLYTYEDNGTDKSRGCRVFGVDMIDYYDEDDN